MVSNVGKVPPGTNSESACRLVKRVSGPQVVHEHTVSKTELSPGHELVGA